MMKSLFRSRIFSFNSSLFLRDSTKLEAFTEFPMRQQADEQGKKVTTGRSWNIDELRLKSDEDLHKLWYVLLREKNLIASDNILKRKITGESGPQGQIGKVRVSMARLKTVLKERKLVRDAYRQHLEDEYVQAQRQEFEKQTKEAEEKEAKEPYVPKITFDLLRAKYADLKRGVDNLDYIKKAAEFDIKKKELKAYLNAKYDYKSKKEAGSEVTQGERKEEGFKSGIIEQLNSGNLKITQEEVLRSHIKNWRMLDLKQRRIVLGALNARRARDAKSEFLKELNLLGQKIAYDNLQRQKTASP